MITRKTYNYDYAPGLATYGLQGLDGSTGKHANNLFYTNFNLNEGATEAFVYQLNNQYVPIKGSTTKTDREYQSGDYFFTTDGRIYELEFYPDNPSVSVVGRIHIDAQTVSQMLHYRDSRLQVNTSTYDGFDITLTDSSVSINKNAAMNITSDRADEDNNINFIQMSAIDINNLTNGDLRIFYNTTDQAYHIESVYPIVIDSSNIKVSNDSPSADVDSYSEIVTNTYPMTKFKQYCDKCTWEKIGTSPNTSLNIDATDVINKLNEVSTGLYCKYYTTNNQKVVPLYNNASVAWRTNAIELSIESDSPIQVSLMYNIEVFITKKS